MAKRSIYTDDIRELLALTGNLGIDPRHVEGYMRLEHGCLDGLSFTQFQEEVVLCAECVRVGGIQKAERCAQSFGL